MKAPTSQAAALSLRRALLAAPFLLMGCSAQITSSGLADVSQMAGPQIASPPQWQRTEEQRQSAREKRDALLAEPLSVDSAVAVAMLSNRSVQADLADLGVASADLAAASRPPNPGFSLARLSRGNELEIERSISANLLGLLAWPVARNIEGRRFAQAKFLTASNLLRKGADTRRAYYRAVAAQQSAQFVAQIQQAAEAQVDLAKRMYGVGNWSLLDYGREQLFYAEVTTLTAQRQLEAARERGRLMRELGLEPGAKLVLPNRLPDLPSAVTEPGSLEAQAMNERLDLRAGRAEVDGLASSYGLTRATRFLNVAEVGYQRNSETGKPRQTGYEISLEVPLFDFGDAKVARAEAIYMQAVDRLAALALDARLDVQDAWLTYRTSYDVAVHYRDHVMPLRQRLSEELAYRYNGMLVSVFDLLRDARERMTASIAAIEAQRDFLIAETDLQFATRIGATPVNLAPAAQSAVAGGDH